jgi:high affinity Mn2+ porin
MEKAAITARAAILATLACAGAPAIAQDEAAAPAPAWYSIHGQTSFIFQYHPAFSAAVSGPNSLSAGANGREAADATLYLGVSPMKGLEFYVDPEIDQGFGLNDTLGVAGFPNGQSAKVGADNPYYETQRAFARYTIDLGGPEQKIDAAQNQIEGSRTADNVILTVGKFSATDIFDTNDYAHDPQKDFLNWSIIDSGAYDYAANAWGYSYGGAVEWTRSWWTVRGGLFDLSNIPNQVNMNPSFSEFEVVTELEERHQVFDRAGKVKFLAYVNRGRMADYNDAVRLAQMTGGAPDVSLVRRYGLRPGAALNLQQEIVDDLGAFARASLNDGHKEAFDYTEINRSVAAGLSLAGKRWHRSDDTFGLALVLNDISKDARNYFAAGGLGILIGDGSLPQAGFEKIAELYYRASVVTGIDATLDYQHVENPGYDALRGPVNILGIRLHAEF